MPGACPSTNPSPQVACLHVVRQLSALLPLPSSQASPAAGLEKPSPQKVVVQSASQKDEFPPESHCSPAAGLRKRSPQTLSVQSESHPAVFPPVSHCSP